MTVLQILVLFTLLSGSWCSKIVNLLSENSEKQLFLSRRVVTETQEFDGGVLVDENGIIEGVFTRETIDLLLSSNNALNYQDVPWVLLVYNYCMVYNFAELYFTLNHPDNVWNINHKFERVEVVDGGDLALMAGIIDSHVHVNEPGRTSWEGYVTATKAAASGGVTTIIDMPLNSIPPTTTLKNLKTKASIAKEEVYVDVGFWGGVVPGNELELHDMIRAGVVGFKCFLIDSGVAEFPNITPDELINIFKVLNGTGTVLAFHAEIKIDNTTTECNDTGCPDPTLFSTYLDSRPAEMELEAVSLLTSFIPNTDLHVHIVHVSAEGIVPILEKARQERISAGYAGWRGGVTAETCHHYLTLNAEDIPPGRTEFKCSPPIRNLRNKEKLWEYIRDERLDLVTSDHSPSVQNLKGSDFMTAWGGISSLQFDLSLFWTQAKARGYGLSTVSHYLSAGPARLCGLSEKKGSLRVGHDADFIFFDPNASFIVTPEIIRYKNKISPYMNRVLTGKVKATYLRGRLIYAEDELVGGPKGKLLLNDDVFNIVREHKVKWQRNVTFHLSKITPAEKPEGSTDLNSSRSEEFMLLVNEEQNTNMFKTQDNVAISINEINEIFLIICTLTVHIIFSVRNHVI